MLKQIMVTLDGSRVGEQALPIARALAERDGARIELVHVYDTIAPHRFVHGAPVFDADFDEELARDRRRYLESLAESLRGQTGQTVEATVLTGNVREVLTEHIAARAPDLVVMTTHGRGGLSRLWLGSTATHLVRHAAARILLIRAQEEQTREVPAPTFRRVLVPLEMQEPSELAINNAIEVAGRDAELVLAHVLVPVVYIAPDAAIGAAYPSEAELLNVAHESLDRVAEGVREQGVRVEIRVEWNSSPAQAILDLADSLDVDLISMETHTVRAIQRALLGSTSDKVVRAASVPVLLQHPR